MLPHIPHPFIFFSRYSLGQFTLAFAYILSHYSPILTFAFVSHVNIYLRATLSVSVIVTDLELENGSEGAGKRKRTQGEGISLPSFGLATYKMQGGIWVSDGPHGRDQEMVDSLLSVADSWLKQLKVQHHDFIYFTSHRG
ncbi:hypothetical protein Vadar_033704 [Vaccinium darrowii]|uniref:Uncharacterized protein n=1 Tax=Vaccinium darrowii TaxID=229202 RepID=A0ACB7XVD5_9ERIC|nr:hypothetical protein Vadar_033704 [Vaccinium darrowii]